MALGKVSHLFSFDTLAYRGVDVKSSNSLEYKLNESTALLGCGISDLDGALEALEDCMLVVTTDIQDKQGNWLVSAPVWQVHGS